MSDNIYNILFCFFLMLFLPVVASAQLDVSNSYSPTQIADMLSGPGVIISNVQFDCPETLAGDSYGWFECEDCNVGMASGLILTSGTIQNAQGPNDGGGTTADNLSGGDPDLNNLIPGYATQDACSVTMEIEVAADTLRFNYVFGSEEYLEYVGSNFNDVFGFFVSGPNPAGGNYNALNIAFIPGTNVPVSINNVNDMNNPTYYTNNGTGGNPPQNASDYFIEYDGFTVKLEAKVAVIPCATYTLKLAVADAGDHSLDSGVFIEAGSITTGDINLTASTALQNQGFSEFNNAIEDCINGIITFDLSAPPQETAVIYYSLSGSAINGVDYLSDTGTEVPDSIVIVPGTTTYDLVIVPISDNITEGLENVTLQLLEIRTLGVNGVGGCSIALDDTISLFIGDNLQVAVAQSMIATCKNTPTPLLGFGAMQWTWDPPLYLSNPNVFNPVCIPQSSVNYTVIGRVGPCVDTAYVQILIDDNFFPDIDTIYSICPGATAQLNASSGNAFLDGFISWSPAAGLSCTACPNPVFSGTTSAIYQASLFDSYGCEYSYNIHVNISGDLGLSDQIYDLCLGEPLSVNLPPADTYNISPTNGVSCANCGNPVFSPTETTTYTVSITQGSCAQSASLVVNIGSSAANAGEDIVGCESISQQIGTPEQPNYTYSWQPTTFIDNPAIAQPTVTLTTADNVSSITYTLTALNTLTNCEIQDEVTVTIGNSLALSIAPIDTIVQGTTVGLSVEGAPANATYIWSPNTSLDNATSATPKATPLITTEYSVTVTSAMGCTGTASVTIPVILPPVLLLPNAFSPNGDDLHDILRPSGRDITGVLSFKVFNRWGQLVYSGSGADASWDGTFKGTTQPIGVYVYLVEYTTLGSNDIKLAKGNVVLIR